MTTQEAIDFFGGTKQLCRFLDINPQSVYSWGTYPSRAKQFELHVRTNGKLRVEPALLEVPGRDELAKFAI